jgi:two-component system cell cycle response regulator
MKVLVADDSAVPRLILERNLTALGHEIASAVDGDEAWALYQSFEPDVVLSDWLMPGLDGIELCHRIRSDPSDRYTYFVLLTAMTEVEHVITAMQAGADDFMVKPLERTALQAALIGARRVTELHEQLRDQRASLERLNSLLFDDARRDPLTLLGNRLRLSEDLAAAVGRVERYGHSYCIALLDIDFFKRYNDHFGHQAGDRLLKEAASAWRTQMRSTDLLARYGGEEFAVLLPTCALDDATRIVERLRAITPQVTCSIGVAFWNFHDSPQELVERADQALYIAKAGGRNRCVAAGPRWASATSGTGLP